jgi:hypothetical protein
MITILDYGLGNPESVRNMIRRLGVNAVISSDKDKIEQAKLLIDKDYVIKKLGLNVDSFNQYMEMEPVSHMAYASYETGIYRKHEKLMQFISPLTKLIKRMFS